MTAEPIYHICKHAEWKAAENTGYYAGSLQDKSDGFIHFSGWDQVVESAAKHRAGQDGLVILKVDPEKLGDSLKWKTSRGGNLFPHLYGQLPFTAVIQQADLPLGDDGRHIFPADWNP